MAKMVIIVERGKGKRNFSCFAPEAICGYVLAGYGASAREAMEDVRLALKEYQAMAAEKGEAFPDVELEFRFDIGAFFDYYPLDVTAVAKYIGMNASVLRQYATSIRMPTQPQIDKIRKGLEKLANDLGSGLMITQPVVSYLK